MYWAIALEDLRLPALGHARRRSWASKHREVHSLDCLSSEPSSGPVSGACRERFSAAEKAPLSLTVFLAGDRSIATTDGFKWRMDTHSHNSHTRRLVKRPNASLTLRAMVLLAVRTGDAADSSRFLCNALTSHHVQEVVEAVVTVHNMRLRLQASVAACTVGAKRPRSEDEAALTAASELLSAQSVRRKVVLTPQQLLDALTSLQAGAADRAVPEELSVEGAELFFAGRTLKRDARLSEYVGKNDKSQVQIQLLRITSGNGGTAPLVPPAPAPAMPPSEPAAASEAATGSSSVPESAVAAVVPAAPAHDAAAGGVSLNSYFKAMRGEPTPEAAVAVAGGKEEGEDPAVLGEEQAARLLRSQPVQAAMRDPRLQELLRCALPGPAR
jgi:hypothetical protein